jgi:putative nucleotidyltransferase with HDIG domain
MTTSRRDLRFPLFAAILVATLAAAVALAVWQGSMDVARLGSRMDIFLVLLAAVVVAELLDVVLPNGQLSVSNPLYVASVVFFGPLGAGIVAATSAVPQWYEKSESITLKLFNTAQMCLSAVVPGLVFVAMGGRPLYLGGGSPALIPLLAAAAAVAVVNLGLGAGGVSLYKQVNLRRLVGSVFVPMLPSQLALGLVGLAVAQVLASIGISGFALFVVPLLVARQTYQRSEELRQAYADTIASLVGAIEAKDVYTKGHSVRVALYAVAVARQLGVSEQRIGRLEWAALLHDIGKVGISGRILAKSDKLSDDEYSEIKRHPEIGARILKDVQYLADLVPAIEAHHERLDGQGYGRGLLGEKIPLEARVLAVADAYDAMTSTRPYREAMSHDAAVGQLLDGRGTQFDEVVVEAFLSVDVSVALKDSGGTRS